MDFIVKGSAAAKAAHTAARHDLQQALAAVGSTSEGDLHSALIRVARAEQAERDARQWAQR